jgi:hypothetical protein
MDKPKVLVGNGGGAQGAQRAGQGRRSILDWVRKAVRRLTRRRNKDKDIEIYPLF